MPKIFIKRFAGTSSNVLTQPANTSSGTLTITTHFISYVHHHYHMQQSAPATIATTSFIRNQPSNHHHHMLCFQPHRQLAATAINTSHTIIIYPC